MKTSNTYSHTPQFNMISKLTKTQINHKLQIIREVNYSEVDAGVIGIPAINDDEIAGDFVAFVENVFEYALDLRDHQLQRRIAAHHAQ